MALRTKRLTCAYCNTKKLRADFPSGTYAQCWTCWLRDNGEKIEPIKRALMDLGKLQLEENPDVAETKRGLKSP